MNKQQYNCEYLQQFCKEYDIELIGEYEKINSKTIIRGKCKSDGCIEIFEKNFRCFAKIQNFGCKKCAKEIRKVRVENTNLKNHGVKHAFQVKEFRDKGKQTNLEKYGCEYATQSELIQIKTKDTNLQKYGVEYSSQDPKTRLKFKETCLNKYGVENPSQSEEIKQLKKNTCFKNYGVEHPSQNPIILEKCLIHGFKYKEYILPSGKIIKYQGYENFALDELLQNNVLEKEIINGCADVPEIWYTGLDKKTHRYYVDLFIPHQNKCIEVKSTYTITSNSETIKLKQQSVKDAGYECEIWVYNDKGIKVECYT